MRILISFAALFLSIILLQLSSGAMGPLDAISGRELGFLTTEIGLLGSAHFFGFFIGAWWAPRLMGSIGHNRAFAVFTAAGAIGILAHTLTNDPDVWALLRILTGICVAGCYTVIEAWLNAKVTNDIRGRVFGVYRIVDMGASMMAQLLIGVLSPASYVSYNILAIACCAAIFPLTLSRATVPITPAAPRLRPITTMRVSPLASMGVLVAGVTSAAFRMVGPIYGAEVGFSQTEIGLFLAAVILGGTLAQIPVGWLADKYARRHVLFALSILSIVASLLVVVAPSFGVGTVYFAAIFFGLTTYPIFSVSSALANDFASAEGTVELAASLMFIYAMGAILSPYIAAGLMGNYGAASLFVFVSAAHLCLALFGLYRMRVRLAPDKAARYLYMPRTSFTVSKFIRGRDKGHANGQSTDAGNAGESPDRR